VLTSFETFDALRSAERSFEDTRRIVNQLAAAVRGTGAAGELVSEDRFLRPPALNELTRGGA
jgi:hypothetical protein